MATPWWWPKVFVEALLPLHHSRCFLGWLAAGALALMDIPRMMWGVLKYLAHSWGAEPRVTVV